MTSPTTNATDTDKATAAASDADAADADIATAADTAANATPPRNRLFEEQAQILESRAHPGAQHLLTLRAPRIAATARPGQFVQLRCAAALPLRRPLSLLRADPARGTVEILFKVVGEGTRLLAQQALGQCLPCLGPIGVPFPVPAPGQRPLLLGGGVGMPPILFLATHLAQLRSRGRRLAPPFAVPFVILGSEVPFPFAPRPSQHLLPGLPAEAIAAVPLLEDLGVPSRLTSNQGLPGCYPGHVTALARAWLDLQPGRLPGQVPAHSPGQAGICIYACGPEPMLRAVAGLCREYGLPGWLSLEEHMACGVGGCAGCTVDIERDGERRRLRVCVDGPVFPVAEVVFS
jgi:dihydroorotate dehydrogenase electron transfer subunit